MNKRGLIKYIIIFMTAFISFYFIITSEIGFGPAFGLPLIFALFFALTVFMYFNKNKISKYKFIYDVILLLLMIFFAVCLVYVFYTDIECYFDYRCSINLESKFTMIYFILLFIMLLFNFRDIFNKTNKVNDIMTIVVSLLILLIHTRYYLDSNFMHKIAGGEGYLQYSYSYITQNYIYFIIMYIVIMLHRRINRR